LTRFLLNRLGQAIIVFLMVSVMVFGALRILPEDPIYSIVGVDSEGYTPAQVAKIKADYGLDKPLPVQYVDWLSHFVVGDWGNSFQNGLPVTRMIKRKLPFTIQLALGALVIGVVFGISTGVVAAIKRNTKWDAIATSSAMVALALPEFWLALVLILFFSVYLDLLPVFGSALIWQDPAFAIKSSILPWVALGIGGAATLMRQSRSSMLETMGEDFIRTARSKGVSERAVIIQHALRNSLLPVVTILGLRIGRIIGGAIIIEVMFAIPGIGQMSVTALTKADYPVIMAITMISSLTIILANLITDITYSYIDPRIRYA